MIKEEIFQVYQEIIQKLEAHSFEISEQSELACKIEWQGWQIFVSFQFPPKVVDRMTRSA